MATETELSKSAPEVFASYELLENILINVLNHKTGGESSEASHANQMRQICSLQRINSTFRNVIARSRTLNEGTFRRYGYNDENAGKEGEDGPKLVLNPLLANLYNCTQTYYAHFFLTGSGNKRSNNFDGEELYVNVSFRGMPKRLTGSGSWRRMLIANKPVHSPLEIKIILGDLSTRDCYELELNGDDTLGALAQKLDARIREVALREYSKKLRPYMYRACHQ